MSEERKFCKDCAWYYPGNGNMYLYSKPACHSDLMPRDVVTGYIEDIPVRFVRDRGDLCGLGAQWFAPIPFGPGRDVLMAAMADNARMKELQSYKLERQAQSQREKDREDKKLIKGLRKTLDRMWARL